MTQSADDRPAGSARAGPWLALWVALAVVAQAMPWATGARRVGLTVAVDRGAARVEARSIGEVGDDAIRKAIQLQRDSLPFWTTLAALGDFLCEPLALALRALAVATLFSGLAALTGRPIGFGSALAECAVAQGYWVAGLAARALLPLALRLPAVETSAVLALPPGTYPAAAWVALRQLDAFALLGWLALARGAWRRGQSNLAAAVFICLVLAAAEAFVRIAGVLVLEAGMRLTLIPENMPQ